MAGDIKKKKISCDAAKKKPDVEYLRELLIWVLNGLHKAHDRVQVEAKTTIAIEPLLRVGATRRAEAAYEEIKKILGRYGAEVDDKRKSGKAVIDSQRYVVLRVVTLRVLDIDIRSIRKRWDKEKRLRAEFEGAERHRKKLPQDLRPQF